MDKCREAFEEWICQRDWFYDYMGDRTKEEILNFDDEGGNYHFSTQQKCWETWQSRQAEVDESNNKELEALRSWFKEMTLSNEKDKRIEEALQLLNTNKSDLGLGFGISEDSINELEKVLRGRVDNE